MEEGDGDVSESVLVDAGATGLSDSSDLGTIERPAAILAFISNRLRSASSSRFFFFSNCSAVISTTGAAVAFAVRFTAGRFGAGAAGMGLAASSSSNCFI